MRFGNLEFHILQECTLKFDGGAMFGHVPKTVWGRIVSSDSANRVQSACNQMLIRLGGKNILTDPGMGLKWNEKEIGLYDLRVKNYEMLLSPLGMTPADIDLVVLSHLHIDHAGGLTRLDMDQVPHLVFPNARVVVQKGEWEAANNPDPRSIPSYRPVDFQPVMDAGKFDLIEGNQEILPGCEVIVTGGHTAHHQIIRFTDGEFSVYCTADIFPSTRHIKPHWVMGYDLYPLDIMKARTDLLARVANSRTLCVFGHDPYLPVGRIRWVEEGKHLVESLSEATQ